MTMKSGGLFLRTSIGESQKHAKCEAEGSLMTRLRVLLLEKGMRNSVVHLLSRLNHNGVLALLLKRGLRCNVLLLLRLNHKICSG